MQQMQQTMMQLAQVLAETTGEARPLAALQQQMGMGMGMQPTASPPQAGAAQQRGAGQSTYEKAAERAKEATTVR